MLNPRTVRLTAFDLLSIQDESGNELLQIRFNDSLSAPAIAISTSLRARAIINPSEDEQIEIFARQPSKP